MQNRTYMVAGDDLAIVRSVSKKGCVTQKPQYPKFTKVVNQIPSRYEKTIYRKLEIIMQLRLLTY